MIQLSSDQDKVLKKLLEWYKEVPQELPRQTSSATPLTSPQPSPERRGRQLTFGSKKGNFQSQSYITLGGYAGTGKTTLLGILREELNKVNKDLKIAFCSYTGKAARVLRNKLQDAGAKFSDDSVGTIHSLIYSPITNDNKEIVGWELQKKVDKDLIIIDEASMVDGSIWSDLQSFDIPIIAVGDHGQLPPISGQFNLMEEPMLRLEEIHRQAKDNPIIKMSIDARTKGIIPFGNFDGKARKMSRQDNESQAELGEILSDYNNDLLVLCGYNNTRTKLNKFIRNALDFRTENPESGDRVICLRNNHLKKIFNGMLGTIQTILPKGQDFFQTDILMDDETKPYNGKILRQQFGEAKALNFTENRKITRDVDLFDFGYALTVHKAQGSQAKKVVLFEERFKQMDDNMWKKWLYTAVTRAEDELFIVG